MSLGGHVSTLRPWLRHQIRPQSPPPSVPWTAVVADPRMGQVRLQGRLTRREGARELLLVVHGLGGSSAAPYAIAAARAADRAGIACLRLDLRGALRDGEDLYHAGLSADIEAALASDALAEHRTVYVLGYSVGGHLALRFATEALDARVRAVAAVCPPIDLERSIAAFDMPERWLYRRHVLAALKSAYAAVVARRSDVALPSLAEARAIAHLRAWDDRIIAPRFGFRSAAHYYAEASVAPRLSRLVCPALLVAATDDPMVPAATVLPALHEEPPLLDVRWIAGGHIGFPASLDLGLGGQTGLEPQILRWLRRAASL